VAKASIIVGDPSYFDAGKTRVVGKVVRSICILNHPIAGTDNAESVQIIIPAKQVSNLFFVFKVYVCLEIFVCCAVFFLRIGRYNIPDDCIFLPAQCALCPSFFLHLTSLIIISLPIIILFTQVKRKNDIYVCMVSFAHCVASAGKYIAIVSTTVETANPIQEIAPGLALVGEIMER